MFQVFVAREQGPPGHTKCPVGKDCVAKSPGGLGTKKYISFHKSTGSQGILETNHYFESLDGCRSSKVHCSSLYFGMNTRP